MAEVVELITRPDLGTYDLYVKQLHNDCFGVFANTLLLAEHSTQKEAEAHCQRLLAQQTLDLNESGR